MLRHAYHSTVVSAILLGVLGDTTGRSGIGITGRFAGWSASWLCGSIRADVTSRVPGWYKVTEDC